MFAPAGGAAAGGAGGEGRGEVYILLLCHRIHSDVAS